MREAERFFIDNIFAEFVIIAKLYGFEMDTANHYDNEPIGISVELNESRSCRIFFRDKDMNTKLYVQALHKVDENNTTYISWAFKTYINKKYLEVEFFRSHNCKPIRKTVNGYFSDYAIMSIVKRALFSKL